MNIHREIGRSMRVLAVMTASAGLTLATLGYSPAPAQGFQGVKGFVPAAEPPDKVDRLLKREADSKTAEHAAMFATIDAIDKKVTPPEVAVKPANRAMEDFMKKAQLKAARAAPPKGEVVMMQAFMKGAQPRNVVAAHQVFVAPAVVENGGKIAVPANAIKLSPAQVAIAAKIVVEKDAKADGAPVSVRANTIKLTPAQEAVAKRSVVVLEPLVADRPVAARVNAIRLMPAQPAVPVQVAQMQQAQQAAMVMQWASQIRPVLKTEYQYIRLICDPPKDKRKPIAHAGEVALHDAAVKFVDWQFNRNGGVGADGRRIGQPEPHRVIRDALAAAAKANLSDELYQRYRKEIDARDAESKHECVLSLVTKLDAHLILSAEQRETIAKALEESWDDSWTSQQAYLNVDVAYFPMIPDKAVVPFLNDPQRKVWTGTQKVNVNNYGFNGMAQDGGPLDDEFPDEPVKDEAKPAAGPAPAALAPAPAAIAVPAPAVPGVRLFTKEAVKAQAKPKAAIPAK